EDLKKHSSLLTRKAIFEVEDLEYEHESALDDLKNYSSRKRHETVDVLVGLTKPDRRPSDAIPKRVFENLEAKVEKACKEISTRATKFIAHAATPNSRSLVNGEDIELTLGELWKANKLMCQVASFLSVHVH